MGPDGELFLKFEGEGQGFILWTFSCKDVVRIFILN